MNNENRGAIAPFIITALWGTGFSALTSVALLFISGALLFLGKDPGRYVTFASLAVLAVSSFIGGYAGAKKGRAFTGGAVSGFLFAAILMVLSLFIKGPEEVTVLGGTAGSLISKAGVIVLSIIGALTASRTGNRKRSLKAAPRAPKIKKI